MNMMDRLVSMVNPQAGVQRMMAREVLHRFGYNDHPERRGDSGGMAKNRGSETAEKGRDRIKAMWDARNLAGYDWIGGVLRRIALYTCGDLRLKSNTGDTEIDARYDQYFSRWAGDEVDDVEDDGTFLCDLTGRHPFSKLVAMSLVAMLIDGDHGTVIRRKPREGEKIDEATGMVCLQEIEADRIGNPMDARFDENYIGGLTLDEDTGAVKAYRVFRRTRMGAYVDGVDVEPQNFIHLWDPERGDQYRGVTYLIKMLTRQRDIKELLDSEIFASKVQSQFAGLITSKDPYSKTGAGQWEGQTAKGTPTQLAEFGKLLKMAEGENVNLLSGPTRPGGAFIQGVQTIIRFIAVCLDLPYGFVWDMAMLGGVTARIEVQQAQRRIQYWQRLLVLRKIRRIRKLVLADGIANQELPAHPKWLHFEAHFGAWIVTDAGYETQNDLALVQAGLMPAADVAAKQNRDLGSVFRRNASAVKMAQEIAAETRVPIELFAGGLLKDATAQLAAMNTPPSDPPDPAPGSIEAVGDNGAKQILEILTHVTQGVLDRSSAVNTLVTVYGMPPEQAEMIVPLERAVLGVDDGVS